MTRLHRMFLLLPVCAVLLAQPPAPTALRPFRLPPVFETKLPNGLSIMLVEDTRLPLVTVRLAFRCGSRRDPDDLPGISAAVADLLTASTRTRGDIQIGEAIDTMGGSLSAISGVDYIELKGSIVADNFAPLLEIMADVARNAELSDIDLRLYRQNRLQSLGAQFAQPVYAANEAFRGALFGTHPYAHMGATSASLQKFRRQDLLEYRDRWLVPNNGVLIVAGKLPARADTMRMISERLGSWEQKPLPEIKPAPLPKPVKRLILVDRPGADQAEIRMGRIAANPHDADYFAQVAEALIAGGTLAVSDEAGILTLTAQVNDDAAGQAVQGMFDHLDGLAAGPSETELADAKNSADAQFLLRLETQAGLADELMGAWIQGLPLNYLETWMPKLEALKPDEIQAAAKKSLSARDCVVVVVGNAAKLQEPLAGIMEKVGKFEVVKSSR